MKAFSLHAVGDLRLVEMPVPQPKSGEALVRIMASGVCGSDIPRIYKKGTYSFPTVLGHEFAGIVEGVGPDTDRSWVGRRAAVFPMLPCRCCPYCEVGQYELCANYDYFGSRRDGGFAEFLAVPLWNLVPLPEGLGYEQAAMCEPCAVSIHALRRAGVNIGESVCVFGAGPIGLMVASWARAWGAGRVILADIDREKIAFADDCGFEHVLDTSSGDVREQVMALTGGRGADVCIEGAGVAPTAALCLECAAPGGRVVLMGNPAGDMLLPQKAYWEILRRQLTVTGTWNSSYSGSQNDWTLSIEAMASGALDVSRFITHRVNLEDCAGAIEMMRDRKTFYNKVMFIFEK